MRLSITGTPGTGKHTIAKTIANDLNLKLIDLGQLAKEKGLARPEPERETSAVDVGKLRKVVGDEDDCIFVSNYAELIPSDLVLVIRCRPNILAARLKKRGYSEKKLRENLEAECIDFCLQAALEHNSNVAEIDNSDDLGDSIMLAESIINGEAEPSYGGCDFLIFVKELDELVGEKAESE